MFTPRMCKVSPYTKSGLTSDRKLNISSTKGRTLQGGSMETTITPVLIPSDFAFAIISMHLRVSISLARVLDAGLIVVCGLANLCILVEIVTASTKDGIDAPKVGVSWIITT